MRPASLAAAAVALLLIGAAPNGSPQTQWQETITAENQHWSGEPHALLKIQDQVRVDEGQSATLIGTAGQPASYRFVEGTKDGGVLVLTFKDGMLTGAMGDRTFDDAALRNGVTVVANIDIQSHVTADGSQSFAAVLLYNQVRAESVDFKGLDYFPYDPAYRVTATFKPDPKMPPRMFRVSRGADRPYYHAGDATFTLNGKTVTLPFYAVTSDPHKIEQLDSFFVDDLTGTQTYGGGRYINVDDFTAFPPASVTIDFNFAYNPLCARSTYFSCPIATDAIALAIKAGEKDPHQAH